MGGTIALVFLELAGAVFFGLLLFALAAPLWWWFFPYLVQDIWFLITFGTIDACILLTILIIVIKERRSTDKRDRVHAGEPFDEVYPMKTGPGFWEIVWTWLAAKHRRICPLVEYPDGY